MPVAEREHRAPQVLPAAGRWDTSHSRPTAVLIVLGKFPGTWTQADNTQRGLSGGSPHMLVSPGHRGCTCSLSIVSDSAPSLRIVPVCVANRHLPAWAMASQGCEALAQEAARARNAQADLPEGGCGRCCVEKSGRKRLTSRLS